MANRALGATPKVIDVLKKTEKLVNTTNLAVNQNDVKLPKTTLVNSEAKTNLIPARVITGNGIHGYICDIYANGLTESPTDRGTIFLPNGGSSIYSLPEGTVLYVQKIAISIDGSDR